MFLAQSDAHAATISTITTISLSDGGYSGTTGSFQKPDGLLLGYDFLTTGTPATTSSRNVRSERNNAQSFTVAADVYPDGIAMTAFVIQFENRANSGATFGVSLFKIESGNANAVPPLVPSANLLSGVSSLVFPTATSLGVPDPQVANNGASGTAIFQFDTPVYLEPGAAYIWQFLPSWTNDGTYSYFDWIHGASYAGGRRYEADQSGGSQSSDHYFGIIGTAVPEPLVGLYSMIALLGFLGVRRRSA